MATKEATLDELIRKRATLKGLSTRFQTFVNNARLSENLDKSLRLQLIARLANFKELFEQYNDVQFRIEFLDIESDHVAERSTFENTYYEYLGNAEELIDKNNSTVSQDVEVSTRNSNQHNRLRLPKIDLPVFTGQLEQWYPFQNTFNSLIHTNVELGAVEKFHFLKSSVQGEAADVISSFELSPEHYETAWKLLAERYDNKRLIIQTHIKQIFDTPAIYKEDAHGLRLIIDKTMKHLRALEALERSTDKWDDLIIHLISTKIDSLTNKEWESSLGRINHPTLKELIDFLTRKCHTLELLTRNSNQSKQHVKIATFPTSKPPAQPQDSCVICHKQHKIFTCDKFLKEDVEQRIRLAQSKNLCTNCLRASNHQAIDCKSGSCRKCNRKHNTLLHKTSQDRPTSTHATQGTSTGSVSNTHTCSAKQQTAQVLLSTAIVNVLDKNNQRVKCRALLDSGSQSNFITSELASRIGVKLQPINSSITGINQATMNIRHQTLMTLQSCHNNFKTNMQCLLLNDITGYLPSMTFEKNQVVIPSNIKLADPEFNVSAQIDMLIGADTFWNLLCVGQIRTCKQQPVFQKTRLGWIISGNLNFASASRKPQNHCLHSSLSDVDNKLEKFWQLEEVPQTTTQNFSEEELACERNFEDTYRREQDGRFCVKLPIKPTAATHFENSKQIAVQRFYSLEKKFIKNPGYAQQYKEFINEYRDLGHMKLVSQPEVEHSTLSYYMPHHAVLKEDSLTTKLRVVFDASAKTGSSSSLNETLMVGPTVQQDIFSIISRFRTHRYVLMADIEKMYRQINIDESQRHLQRILWRDNQHDRFQTYELTTVTYGTAAAPYLATRCLQQLGKDFEFTHPNASKIILRDFYVDDLLTGASTREGATEIIGLVSEILHSAGFNLRKWISNDMSLLQHESVQKADNTILSLNTDGIHKALGLYWNAVEDSFQFYSPSAAPSRKITKRSILSQVAQVFDPLGLLNPIIINAKLIMQQLWQLKVDWDESVPISLHTQWEQYSRSIQDIQLIKIPRNIISTGNVTRLEAHGFCDASEQAYGACIYIRATDCKGNHSANLVCSKSRVAPLRNVSLPRLELCGAVLLAKLMQAALGALSLNINATYYWTDSTIVLAWLNSTSRNWKTFVANRVSEIQSCSKIQAWNHVTSENNPADIVSRGTQARDLSHSELWWHGPAWLLLNSQLWPKTEVPRKEVTLEKRHTTTTLISAHEEPFELFDKYSSLTKLVRVSAYCIRFYVNIRARKAALPENHGTLTVAELNTATNKLIMIAQRTSFPTELHDLEKHGHVGRKSRILSLHPFADENGIIRVGGRLQNAEIASDQKHPIILPRGHNFTKLVVTDEHIRNCHAGAQLTLSAVRQHYWPISGRNIVRLVIKKCVTCFRTKPIPFQQLMGNLPEHRVLEARPFTNCGVDFFGPLYLRVGRRGTKSTKAYGSIFVCFATKAVHIELVSDLSTAAFLAALKRFTARRGKIANIHSDNGTNFVGANKELRELNEFVRNEAHQAEISTELSRQNMQWHFIPASSPHFGGLWEAAVKSAKSHLRKVAGNTPLTFEEMTTLLAQIEAILNSRPITPMSSDPNDLSFLTPGHFLIGAPLTADAEPTLLHLPVNRLSKWQHLEQMRQHFWKRWRMEYVNQLQQRVKWRNNSRSNPIQVGDLVIIKEDNVPPLFWMMGRIEAIHSGNDGITRAATVKTTKGSLRRATTKLCPLPSP